MCAGRETVQIKLVNIILYCYGEMVSALWNVNVFKYLIYKRQHLPLFGASLWSRVSVPGSFPETQDPVWFSASFFIPGYISYPGMIGIMIGCFIYLLIRYYTDKMLSIFITNHQWSLWALIGNRRTHTKHYLNAERLINRSSNFD